MAQQSKLKTKKDKDNDAEKFKDSNNLKNSNKQIEWRRNKVRQLLLRGNTQSEISGILHISQPTISRDIDYIRSKYITNSKNTYRRLSEEYINISLGIDEMIKVLMNKTWKAARLKGLQGLIQLQNEQLMLTYLIGVSLNNDASFAAQAAMLKAIEDIKEYATKQLPSATDISKGHLLLTLDRIKNYRDSKPFVPESMPPGAPIGCDWEK